MRKSSIAFFDRNDDVLAAPGYVQLGNPIVVAAMSTGFEPVSRDTHFITCRARYILSNNLKATVYQESEIFGAETALDTARVLVPHDEAGRKFDDATKALLEVADLTDLEFLGLGCCCDATPPLSPGWRVRLAACFGAGCCPCSSIDVASAPESAAG